MRLAMLVSITTGALIGCNGGGGTCEYNGETYEKGESFPAEDGCNTCTCEEKGAVACTEMGCLTPTGDTGAR